MSRAAYLVVHIDTTQQPPVVTRAGIYSEPAQSLTGAFSLTTSAADVVSSEGEDYTEARRSLVSFIETYPMFQWVKPFLSEFRENTPVQAGA